MREFYIFGSVCRGEPDEGSDVDVLVVAENGRAHLNLPAAWSCYGRNRLRILFRRGTLFAWHLYLESVQLWPLGPGGYLKKIGPPKPYTGAIREITDLQHILLDASKELLGGTQSPVYEFGLLALACRDAAMAASSTLVGQFDFSRYAPLHLPARFPLSKAQFDYLLKCRRASTRGDDLRRRPQVERLIISRLPKLKTWCATLLYRVKNEQLPPQN